jgi:hypothetical protein
VAPARALRRFLFEGSSPERLAATRFLLGLGLAPFFLTQYGAAFDVAPFGAHWHYLDPVWYFRLLGIESNVPWLAMAGVALLMAALVCFALGLRTRLVAWLALILILLLTGARDSVAGDVHHRELIPFHILFFFACSRCGDVASLDARRAPRPPLAEWEASWPIRAAQLYVASFYLWSGLAKLRLSGLDWFAGGEAMQSLLLGRAVRFGIGDGGDPAGSALGLWLARYPEVLMLAAIGVLAMEIGFPILLFLRSLRLRVAFLAGVTFFHVANFVLMDVMFLLLPVVFVLFFDVTPLAARLLPRGTPAPGGRATLARTLPG